MQVAQPLTVRRELRPSDAQAIADLHDRVYRTEYAMNDAFVDAVAAAVHTSIERGWPQHGGGAWLVDDPADGRLIGSIGLTRESASVGQVRWVVFEPQLRGQGLGRRLIGELLAEARAQSMERLELDTFSELTGAAHIYRSVGFRMTSARERDDWGRRITYQHYVLDPLTE